MALPDDDLTTNRLLDQLSQQIFRRHELVQKLLPQLHNFGSGPRNLDIAPNYKLDDVEAVKPIFEKFGFRVEIRFASQSTHMRFYRE